MGVLDNLQGKSRIQFHVYQLKLAVATSVSSNYLQHISMFCKQATVHSSVSVDKIT